MTRSRGRRVLAAVVTVTEALALLAAVVFVVALFVNEPSDPAGTASAAADEGEVDGATLFAARCAACHGADAGGGVGPGLSDGRVVTQYPDPADQIAVVTEGRGGMPSFGDSLTPAEIAAVVDDTRSL